MIFEIRSKTEALALLARAGESAGLLAAIEASGEELPPEVRVLAAGPDGRWGAAFRLGNELYVDAVTERTAKELIQRGARPSPVSIISSQEWIERRAAVFLRILRTQLPGVESRVFGSRLESQKDPVVELARSLQTEKGRADSGCYAAHGSLLADRTLAACAPIAAMLFVDRFAAGDGAELARLAAAERVPWFVITEGLMRKCTDSAFVPPVLTIVHRITVPPDDVRIHDEFLAVLAENIEEHGNLGMILRTADAVAADLVFTSGCDPFHWRAVTGSRGSIFRVPLCPVPNSASHTLSLSKGRTRQSAPEARIVAAVTGTQKSYTELDYTGPTLFLVGNESHGLSEQALASATDRVTIPMPGGTDSLNVGVSSGVLLYEALRQRSAKP